MQPDATTSAPREDVGAIVARRFAELEDEAAAVAGPSTDEWAATCTPPSESGWRTLRRPAGTAPVRRRAEVLVESFSYFAKSLLADISVDGRWWPVLVDTKNVDHETRWRRVAEEAFEASRGRR